MDGTLQGRHKQVPALTLLPDVQAVVAGRTVRAEGKADVPAQPRLQGHDLSFRRLVAGGLLGPLPALLYIVGSYHLYLRTQKPYRCSARVMFVIFAAGWMVDETYHGFLAF